MVNNYPMTKNKLINQSRISKGWGFTMTFPSIYVLSVINWFIFGHVVVIYFIMPLLLEKRSENLHFFPSQWGFLQSAIWFMLSTAAAMIVQTKSVLCQYIMM